MSLELKKCQSALLLRRRLQERRRKKSLLALPPPSPPPKGKENIQLEVGDSIPFDEERLKTFPPSPPKDGRDRVQSPPGVPPSAKPAVNSDSPLLRGRQFKAAAQPNQTKAILSSKSENDHAETHRMQQYHNLEHELNQLLRNGGSVENMLLVFDKIRDDRLGPSDNDDEVYLREEAKTIVNDCLRCILSCSISLCPSIRQHLAISNEIYHTVLSTHQNIQLR